MNIYCRAKYFGFAEQYGSGIQIEFDIDQMKKGTTVFVVYGHVINEKLVQYLLA